jgi:hypothetical protein
VVSDTIGDTWPSGDGEWEWRSSRSDGDAP